MAVAFTNIVVDLYVGLWNSSRFLELGLDEINFWAVKCPKALMKKLFPTSYSSLPNRTLTCENLVLCCSSLGYIAILAKQADSFEDWCQLYGQESNYLDVRS